jgi:hypothetical protein
VGFYGRGFPFPATHAQGDRFRSVTVSKAKEYAANSTITYERIEDVNSYMKGVTMPQGPASSGQGGIRK